MSLETRDTPWKPATMTTAPVASASEMRPGVTAMMRALPWVASVMMPAWLPVRLVAVWPCSWMAMASRAIEMRSPAVSSMSSSRPGGMSEISLIPPGRELDMLLTAGERISMALLAMAIHEHGHTATSLTGSQAGIITDATHGKARIIAVTTGRISDALATGAVVIVAGFQGVSRVSRDITTLGRGGSDTTAVALAAAVVSEPPRPSVV